MKHIKLFENFNESKHIDKLSKKMDDYVEREKSILKEISDLEKDGKKLKDHRASDIRVTKAKKKLKDIRTSISNLQGDIDYYEIHNESKEEFKEPKWGGNAWQKIADDASKYYAEGTGYKSAAKSMKIPDSYMKKIYKYLKEDQ